jgi:hypothetical protein
VEHQLVEEGVGQRLLQGYLRQLAKLTAQLQTDLDEAPDTGAD